MMSSPGIGVQHFERYTIKSSWPPRTTIAPSFKPSMRLTVETIFGCLSSPGSAIGWPVALASTWRGDHFPSARMAWGSFHAAAAVVGRHALPVLIRNFLQRNVCLPRFLFKQPAAHIGGLRALVQINPLPYFAACARSVDKAQPVARRLVPFLRQDFDHVAIGQRMPKRHQRAIHLCAAALMPDLRVNRVGKINRSRAARQNAHAPFR